MANKKTPRQGPKFTPSLSLLDEIATTENEKNKEVEIDLIDPYFNHPFKLYSEDRMKDLVESVKTYGVLVPIVIRAAKTHGRYEALSGHNRLAAAKRAGLATIPAIVVEGLTEDEAAMVVIETNAMQRSFTDISYSERAKAIAMQYEIMKKGKYRRDIIDGIIKMEGDEDAVPDAGSEATSIYNMKQSSIYYYIRIASLGEKGLQLIDDGMISVKAGNQISYIPEEEREVIYRCVESMEEKITPEKAEALRKESKTEALSEKTVLSILSGKYFEKPRPKSGIVRIPAKTWAKYFPEGTDTKRANQVVETLLFSFAEKWRPHFGGDVTEEEMVDRITELLKNNA